MSYSTVKRAINKRLRSLNYYSRVAVEFPAEKRIVYMTECEIRALQIEVYMRFKLGNWKCVESFTSQFIIYNGRTKRGSQPMHWDKDTPGKFIEPFKPGFFDINDYLAIELFDLTNKL